MNNTNKSTPVHTGSGPLFQTPILSPDENTFIRSPYEIPKMRKLSYLMDADQILEENYNYHDSNKLFYKHKEQNAKESAINMTNKILNQCQKAMTNPSFFQERSSFLSENDEFCSEQAYLHKDLNKSKSEEFSIVSMPAKLENLEGFDGFNFAHGNFEKSPKNQKNSNIIIEKTLESTDRDQRLLEHEEEDLNIEKSSDIFQENSEILNFKEGNAHMNIAEYNENLVRNPQKDKVLHELQLKDAIHRQNLGKMRRFIDELKKELDECKGKNEILLKERENVYYRRILLFY